VLLGWGAVVIVDLHPEVDAADPPAAESVGRAAHGDAAQPEERVRGRLHAGEVHIELQKDVLRDLLGEAPVARHTPGEGEHHGLVFVDKSLEVGVPGAGHRGSRLPSYPQE